LISDVLSGFWDFLYQDTFGRDFEDEYREYREQMFEYARERFR
jgi:hypothetical protein